jgi:hypothetical protein
MWGGVISILCTILYFLPISYGSKTIPISGSVLNGHACSVKSMHLNGSSMPFYFGWFPVNGDSLQTVALVRSGDVDIANLTEPNDMLDALGL